MDQLDGSMLEVWQEAGRHTDLNASAERILATLQRLMPVDTLVIRRLDPHRPGVETVAHASSSLATARAGLRTACTPQEYEALLAWCRVGQPARLAEPQHHGLAGLIVPPGFAGPVLAAPLVCAHEPVGVLLLVGAGLEPCTAAHLNLLGRIAEPISIALENHRRIHELETLRQAAEADRQALLTRLGRQNISESIVGADAGLRPVMERVELVARSDLPVLIFGETGSGKEVIARAIHSRSDRAAGPFMRANCGAIPPELMDSELFGHERGSFTGATSLRKGWFERADGGTLFLDEVGELPLAAQVRLLRILQDGTFERVGGQQQLHVDVRVVAATHRNLQALMTAGRFREDLWYRVAVFPIHLPAVRERPEDIPALATHLALRASRRFGLPVLIPTPEDMNLLIAYPWPGNVREMAAVIDRAAILGNGRHLEIATALGMPTRPDSIPPAVPGGSADPWSAGSGPTPVTTVNPAADRASDVPADRAANSPAETSSTFHTIDPPTETGSTFHIIESPAELSSPFPTLNAAMRAHIEAALRATHGRIEGHRGAARLLGINPHTLRARMRKLGLDWKTFRPTD